MTPMDAMMTGVHMDMRALHGDDYDADEFADVARAYMECIDKEGLVFDFDTAWQWAGYSRKDNAKRVLLRTRTLKEGRDYQIRVVPVARAPLGNDLSDQRDQVSEGDVGTGALHPALSRGGDRRTESIMMTARALNQFALLAQTERGNMLRDFVGGMMRGLARLDNALRSGEVELRRVAPQSDDRDTKRVKVCDTQKKLMQAVSGRQGMTGARCAFINGTTNKTITGRYKHELAKQLGLPAARVNARDYMTYEQLIGAEFIEAMSAKNMRERPGEDPVAIHEETARRTIHQVVLDALHAEPIPEPRSLRNVRKDALLALPAPPVAVAVAAVAAVVAAPPAPVVNNIFNYFAARVTNNNA
jgi:hypothetical protein